MFEWKLRCMLVLLAESLCFYVGKLNRDHAKRLFKYKGKKINKRN